jgi:hypothetical protein
MLSEFALLFENPLLCFVCLEREINAFMDITGLIHYPEMVAFDTVPDECELMCDDPHLDLFINGNT